MLKQMRSCRWLLLLTALLAGQGLLGCSTTLCKKRLYLFRDAPEKRQPPAGMALLITDPNMAGAVTAGRFQIKGGGQWAEDKPAHESDAYQLSIEALDGKPVYQGLCLDTAPTYACEVRPGSREVRVRLDLFGPWGHEKKKEIKKLTLEPGKAYFLQPDGGELQNKNFVVKVAPLPDAYTPELRAQVVNWERSHWPGRELAE